MKLLAAIAMVAFVSAFCLPSRVHAQNCKKGIPCGNSCISASKVCRVGTGSAHSSSSDAPASPSTAQAVVGSPPPPMKWVASEADGVYFLAICIAAQDLAPSNRKYFKSEAEAQTAGYRRSRTTGC